MDVGASYPVSALSSLESAGRAVSDEGEDAEVQLVLASSAVGPLAVPEAAGTAKLPADVADNGSVSAKSEATGAIV